MNGNRGQKVRITSAISPFSLHAWPSASAWLENVPGTKSNALKPAAMLEPADDLPKAQTDRGTIEGRFGGNLFSRVVAKKFSSNSLQRQRFRHPPACAGAFLSVLGGSEGSSALKHPVRGNVAFKLHRRAVIHRPGLGPPEKLSLCCPKFQKGNLNDAV